MNGLKNQLERRDRLLLDSTVSLLDAEKRDNDKPDSKPLVHQHHCLVEENKDSIYFSFFGKIKLIH